MSRLFKGYASAYEANQSQPRRVRRQQKRTISVDFNGAMDVGRLISSVTWECTAPWVVTMASPAIATNRRSASVNVTFNYCGNCAVKATVTLDDGVILNYEFTYDVTDAPQYPSAVYSVVSGPFSVTAVAP